ncbi:MAG: hypothetical protein KUA38_10120 [Hydrogenophaga sp.]|nr:hypothetical protein [Hydrogenophaga sp.]
MTAVTYAQILCSDPPGHRRESKHTSPAGHILKPLISLTFYFCPFSGQFKKTLDLQGLPVGTQALSTKLSTERWGIGRSQVKSKTYATF